MQFFKFIIIVRDSHCDYSLWLLKTYLRHRTNIANVDCMDIIYGLLHYAVSNS